MTTPPAFFGERREWSRWKHEILRRYIPRFANILGSRYPAIYYVDGFAGAGQYGDKTPVPGSPLIAAGFAEAIADSADKSYSLRCINVEPTHFAELCAATSSYAPPVVTNIRGTFREALPRILREIGPAPTLFFLDPFGYDGMEWDVISQLVKRPESAKTELLISFMVSKIDRDAGWIDSPGTASPAFVQHVNDLLGTDAWQQIVNLPQDQRFEALKSIYADNLAKAFCGIVRSYPIRSIEGDLKYYVLYVTCNKRGCREMSDVIYRVEEGYRAAKARFEESRTSQLSMLGDLFDDAKPPTEDEQIEEVVGPLVTDVYQLGTKMQHTTFGEIQDELSTKWFGLATEKHFREACKRLIRRGKISRDKETGIEGSTWFRFA